MDFDGDDELIWKITTADCVNVGCPGAVDVFACIATDCPLIKEKERKEK